MLASALMCIHCEGLVHQDLHPGNVLRTRDGSEWRLSDFGSARWTKHQDGAPTRITIPTYAIHCSSLCPCIGCVHMATLYSKAMYLGLHAIVFAFQRLPVFSFPHAYRFWLLMIDLLMFELMFMLQNLHGHLLAVECGMPEYPHS